MLAVSTAIKIIMDFVHFFQVLTLPFQVQIGLQNSKGRS